MPATCVTADKIPNEQFDDYTEHIGPCFHDLLSEYTSYRLTSSFDSEPLQDILPGRNHGHRSRISLQNVHNKVCSPVSASYDLALHPQV